MNNINHVSCYIKDYPRPQFVRKSWQSLNGSWEFAFDYKKEGIKKRWFENFPEGLKIEVPFAYNTQMSGINSEKRCDRVWYKRKINICDIHGLDVLLYFEGSDYTTKLYVNGKYAGNRCGGYVRHVFDITDFLIEGENEIVVAVSDDCSLEKPRGKQRWKNKNFLCFYHETTGIYKSVWLEFASKKRINEVKITPNAKEKKVNFEFYVNCKNYEIETEIFYSGKSLLKEKSSNFLCVSLKDEAHFWNILSPKLYDVVFRLIVDGKICDTVYSYFGLRDINIRNAQIFLNGKKIYQKLILDQGYYKESLLTPPNEFALYNDINLCIKAGFNGARKHQKVEDERYLYYADILGFLVWAEMPAFYRQTEKSKRRFEKEWLLCVKQQYNHPCVITWVPFNESWGYGQNLDVCLDTEPYEFGVKIYNLTKQFDKTRPVITNDGWLHTVSDILTIHDYGQDADKLKSFYKDISDVSVKNNITTGLAPFVKGYSYKNQPIMFTEFGGTAFVKDAKGKSRGYGSGVKNEEEFLTRLKSLVDLWNELPFCSGYCYTQLSDVEQEVNGLFSFDSSRKPKVKLSEIKKILSKKNK